jgi:signal-transduction protein with cAMP-binding, CBS, and nucleotidyltransferase domain
MNAVTAPEPTNLAGAVRLEDCGLRPPAIIDPATTLIDAARALREAGTSSLLVGRPGELVAIVTERDFVEALARGLDPQVIVAHIAVANPYVIDANATLWDAGQMMARHHIRHLLVTSGDGRPVAVVSMRDVIAGLMTTSRPDLVLAVLSHTVADRSELWFG